MYDLATEYPEVIDIMIELRFKDISNPVALIPWERVMTIQRDHRLRNLDSIVSLFEEERGLRL